MKYKPSFSEIFAALNDNTYHKGLIKKRIIKIILGSSVIRALPAGTKPILMPCLESLPVYELLKTNSQKAFNIWHKKQVAKVKKCLIRCNKESKRFDKDEQLFGHAAKILNLFLSHLVLYSAYFSQHVIIKTKYFLHVPLDRNVFSAIGVDESLKAPTSIKSLKSKTYYLIQDAIRESAAKSDLPAIYFDEYAWTKDDD